MEKIKISFDYDSTLSTQPMQQLAKKFIALGAEVFVTTSRATKMEGGVRFRNDDLFKVTDELGIPRTNITFTNFEDKYRFVKDCDLHFDDDELEISLINDFPIGICTGVLYEHNYARENKQVKF